MTVDRQKPKASFKGFEFPIKTHDWKGGPQGAHHQYAARDRGDVEHLGTQDDKIKIDAALFGDDCFQQRDTLIKLLLEPGPGELVHPWYGRLQVSVAPGNGFSISGQGNEDGVVYISMNFIRHGQAAGISYQTNTAADLKAATSEARTTATETFLNNVKEKNVPGFVREGMRQDIRTLQEAAQDLGYSEEVVSQVTEELETAEKIATAIQKATSFIGQAANVLGVSSRLPTKYQSLLEDIPNAAGEFATAARQAQAYNRQLTTGLVSSSAAITYAETSVGAEFNTYDDAVQALRKGQALMDRAIEDNENDQVVEALHLVKTAFSKHVQSTGADLSRIVKVTHAFTQPAVLRAYDLYEDLDREEEILKRNDIRNPNKVLPTEPLEVLSV